MNVGQLKQLIADMPDEAEVLARDRDCIGLDMVDVVGHPKPLFEGDKRIDGLKFHKTMYTVYGGDAYPEVAQAIIFCDCD